MGHNDVTWMWSGYGDVMRAQHNFKNKKMKNKKE
jgi:hypothetical protein